MLSSCDSRLVVDKEVRTNYGLVPREDHTIKELVPKVLAYPLPLFLATEAAVWDVRFVRVRSATSPAILSFFVHNLRLGNRAGANLDLDSARNHILDSLHSPLHGRKVSEEALRTKEGLCLVVKCSRNGFFHPILIHQNALR